MKKTIFYFFILFGMACTSKSESGGDATPKEAEVHTRTEVSISSVEFSPISESIGLNAVSTFIRKNEIRSTAAGYVNTIRVQLGDPVHRGQVLLLLRTKESTALGNTLFPNDSSLQFSGIIPIKASGDGFVSSIHHQNQDFVQEGDSLVTIEDRNSLVFMVGVPFEWSRYVHIGLRCIIKLPDGRNISGTLFQKVSIMDLGSQTQNYMVRMDTHLNLPENLIARIEIAKENKKSTLTVLKSAVLTNEEETQFWVMKVIQDTLAIRVPIQKGIENGERVEILGDSLKPGDRVVSTGNFGLPDSSSIIIQKN